MKYFFAFLFFHCLLILNICEGQTPAVFFEENSSALKLRRAETITEIQTTNRFNRQQAVIAPGNDNCASATLIGVNAACISGTTENGTTQAGENLTPPCVGSAFNETVWYRFTATSATMYVQTNLTGFGGSGALWSPTQWAVAVYKSNTCLPSAASLVSCNNSNTVGTGDGIIENIMSGLTIGATYYIQVGYRTGMGVNQIPIYCIRVGDQFTPACTTCSSPCGPACGYTTTPTVATVTATCPPYTQSPYIEGNVASSQCYTFFAVNTTVSFNVIVNSTCQSGNVTGFTWNLYSSGCGAPIQSGTLSNLTFTGLTIGQQYTYCYTFTTPTNCYHTAYYPYFVGASPLPVDLISFEGKNYRDGVRLNWITASEINNDRFILERSVDGLEFLQVTTITGHGTTSETNQYEFFDYNVWGETVYYRLKQIDFDGTVKTFPDIAVRLKENKFKLILSPNPANDVVQLFVANPDGPTKGTIMVSNLSGQVIYQSPVLFQKGTTTHQLLLNDFKNGLYFIKAIREDAISFQKLEVIH